MNARGDNLSHMQVINTGKKGQADPYRVAVATVNIDSERNIVKLFRQQELETIIVHTVAVVKTIRTSYLLVGLLKKIGLDLFNCLRTFGSI